MPKKLRPIVDFMAFKCRTLRVKAVGASVHSPAGSRGVCISGSNAAYTKF